MRKSSVKEQPGLLLSNQLASTLSIRKLSWPRTESEVPFALGCTLLSYFFIHSSFFLQQRIISLFVTVLSFQSPSMTNTGTTIVCPRECLPELGLGAPVEKWPGLRGSLASASRSVPAPRHRLRSQPGAALVGAGHLAQAMCKYVQMKSSFTTWPRHELGILWTVCTCT